LQWSNDLPESVQVIITNNQGQIVYNKKSRTGQTNQIQTTGLPAGLYTVQVVGSQYSGIRKLVIH